MDDGFKRTTSDGAVQEKDLERVLAAGDAAVTAIVPDEEQDEEELAPVSSAASEQLPFSQGQVRGAGCYDCCGAGAKCMC